MNSWEVLKNKKIIDLLIGDEIIIDDLFFNYKMPYMTGKDICEFSSRMEYIQNYKPEIKKARWQYMKDLIDYVIANDKTDLFFKELFSLKRFENIKQEGEYRSSSELYWEIINKTIFKINELLFFSGCHIEYNLETWQFSLVDSESGASVISEHIHLIDRDYIKRLKNEIENTIKNGDYESTITKSKTLVEEILKYGIELKNGEYSSSISIQELFRVFKEHYNMHANKDIDKRINNLISGLTKIVTSLSEMRNSCSDSHGVGNKRIKLKEHHVILCSNSAITLAEFLLSVIENNN